eukprot:795103-Prorocentrum_minimum.AAC.2
MESAKGSSINHQQNILQPNQPRRCIRRISPVGFFGRRKRPRASAPTADCCKSGCTVRKGGYRIWPTVAGYSASSDYRESQELGSVYSAGSGTQDRVSIAGRKGGS